MVNKVLDTEGFYITAIGSPGSLERAKSRGYGDEEEMMIADSRCPDCGYTLLDAKQLMDHNRCENREPPWKEYL